MKKGKKTLPIEAVDILENTVFVQQGRRTDTRPQVWFQSTPSPELKKIVDIWMSTFAKNFSFREYCNIILTKVPGDS